MNEFQIDNRLVDASPPLAATPAASGITCLRWWCRPHPLTYAVVLVVGSVLAYGQFLRVEQRFKTPPPNYSLGWPSSYAMKWSPSSPLDGVRWRSLAIDVGWWFAMIMGPLITAERLARRRFRFSPRTLVSTGAAAAIMLTWTDWLSCYVTIRYEPGRVPFDLALLFVRFCWLEIVASAVISSFAEVWNRSSHPFTLVASYIFIGSVVIGFDVWLYSNGFVRSGNVLREWLPWTLFVGTVVTLIFGALVWLSAVLRGMIGNRRKLPRIGNR